MIRHKITFVDDFGSTYDKFVELPFRIVVGDILETKYFSDSEMDNFLNEKNIHISNTKDRFSGYPYQFFSALVYIEKDDRGYFISVQANEGDGQ